MKKINKTKARMELANRAMPEVKKLVQRYGRTSVQSCLNKLRDYDKKIRQLEIAKKEVEDFEKKVVRP